MPTRARDVFVTMNPHVAPHPDTVVARRRFLHPIAGPRRDEAAATIESMQGQRNTWFAGAYLRTPFVHESAISSGIRAAELVVGSHDRRWSRRLAGAQR